jgi:predicted TIM-barrel fold metal-dependent hydrolase
MEPMSNYLVISSDCHAGPPAEKYRDYIDPEHRAAYDDFLKQADGHREMLRKASNDAGKEFREQWTEETGDGGLRAAWDPRRRDEELDKDGVAAEVIFPDADVLGLAGTVSSPFGSGLGSSGADDGVLTMAGARAHNRWLADLCSVSPERRAGVAVVPVLHDIDAAIREIRRAHASGVRGGIMIPTQWAPYPSYNDLRYEPIWATCAELGLTVHTHSGGAPRDISMAPGMLGIATSEAWFWAARPLWVMLWGGIFERHPKLKFAVAEDGAWWVPDLLQRMDEKYVGAHNTRKFGDAYRFGLKMKPSDYFRRNCFLGASTPSAIEVARRHDIGIDNLMWGNDFPHPEGTWPHTREWIRVRFHDVPEADTRKILGFNALRVYPFDAQKLAPLVARIGPSTHEVHELPAPAEPS